MPTDSTADLVRRTLAGETAAFAGLVDRYRDLVFSLARQRGQDAARAEDMAQETLLRAYRDLHRLRAPERFASWIYGIALNVIREHARHPSPLPLDAAPEPATEPPPAPSADVETILQIVSRLPDKYRLPLTLYYLREMKYPRIAEELGITETSTRVLVHRAREMVRRRWKREN